jgi:hypothetical protein
LLEILGFGFLVAGSFGLVKRYTPPVVSFVGFYAAGSLAVAGTPELAYDNSKRFAAEQTAIQKTDIHNILFLYPPVYLLLCAPLALLPYLPALIAFEVITLCLFLFVVRGILRERGWSWLVPVLAFPGVFWTLGFGQNAFLSAALLGAATLLIDTRPVAAGILFGLLCYKPEFGLLVPVALIAGRRWSAFSAATLSVAFLVGLSVVVFGWDTWLSFLQSFGESGAQTFGSGQVQLTGARGLLSDQLIGSMTFFTAALLLGLPIALAYLIQAAAMLAGVILVGWSWWRNSSLPTRAAALAAGTLIATPYVLLYDIMLAMVAMAWLVRAGRISGFLPNEKAVFVGIYIMPLVSTVAAIKLHLPLGPFVTTALVMICAFRGWHEIHGNRGSATDICPSARS